MPVFYGLERKQNNDLNEARQGPACVVDDLVFGEVERGPSDDLRLQFEALSQFDEEDRKVARAVLESLILKHNAKRAFVESVK